MPGTHHVDAVITKDRSFLHLVKVNQEVNQASSSGVVVVRNKVRQSYISRTV